MKLTLYNLLLFFLFSCVVKNNNVKSQNKNLNCNENKIFKKEFYRNINIIDSLIYKKQDEHFKKSLLFISKYSHVSFESMANYARIYPGGIYKEDRIRWIEWYERNKCNDIQFKK
ncbi:hypothetical protein GCM10010992_27840 [Cloacibacterium rupense]|uniref:Lipoprotein n=1 Tax=Cloacibacterium rupense TaxID=517423 RepID=A0ABQ2NLZ0_9FLAO|nr:hypothetical protein [Cloacibacterium rupense]GGP06743.1 hypothetical protein GCM10010992_27840 [Cloacibacterium rupense]